MKLRTRRILITGILFVLFSFLPVVPQIQYAQQIGSGTRDKNTRHTVFFPLYMGIFGQYKVLQSDDYGDWRANTRNSSAAFFAILIVSNMLAVASEKVFPPHRNGSAT